MTDIDDHGRPEPPLTGDERATLEGFLDYQRATLAWKCSNLDHAGFTAATAASSMTLGGVMKHMAYVEDYWFAQWWDGGEASAPWRDVEWASDPDWEWHSARDDSPSEIRALWERAVARSRAVVASSVSEGLGAPTRRRWPDGRAPSRRWILCHMIEEYARHNGHADLLREAIDGETGE